MGLEPALELITASAVDSIPVPSGESLREALATPEQIGGVLGIAMEWQHLDADRAFALLSGFRKRATSTGATSPSR